MNSLSIQAPAHLAWSWGGFVASALRELNMDLFRKMRACITAVGAMQWVHVHGRRRCGAFCVYVLVYIRCRLLFVQHACCCESVQS